MAIAALSTASLSQYVLTSSNVVKSDQAWQSVGQSLAAGNLSAAQTAFKTYQQLNQNLAAAGSTSSASSQLTKDLAALGTALGSGNLQSAQSAYATVQSDLKSSPSQAQATANAAVAQTVQWVDELLNFPDSSSNTSTTPTDPLTSLLDSAFGVNPSSGTTDPTTALLESKYGANAASPTAPTAATSGNSGSSASVNLYA